jgi:hypothetical protein
MQRRRLPARAASVTWLVRNVTSHKSRPSSPGKVDEVPVHRRGKGRVGNAYIQSVMPAHPLRNIFGALDTV